MKTMTHTTKARATRKSDFITVKPYTVPVEWVEITVQIPADLADELDQRTDHIRSRYGKDVLSRALSVITHGRDGASPAIIHTRLRSSATNPLWIEAELLPPHGKRMKAFTVKMEKHWWNHVRQAAKLLEVEPPAFIRAALLDRRRGIREFDRAESARAKGGQA